MPLPDLIDNGLEFSQLPCPANTAAAKAPAGAPAAARAQPGLTNWEPGDAPPRDSALFQHPVKELRRPAHLFGGIAHVQAVA